MLSKTAGELVVGDIIVVDNMHANWTAVVTGIVEQPSKGLLGHRMLVIEYTLLTDSYSPAGTECDFIVSDNALIGDGVISVSA